MSALFRKAFGIYPGDGKLALHFCRLSFLWALATNLFETLSDGLFLEKIGAPFLPRVYFWIALAMIGVSTLVLYSLKRSSPYRILRVAMGVGIFTLVSVSFLIEMNPPPIFWYGIKIASKMFFTVMIAGSWTFIDQYHDLQDAKRVYALYSASYFFGSIVAGVLINLILEWIHTSGLLTIAALSTLLAMNEARRIAHQTTAIHDDSMEGVFSASRDSFGFVFRLIGRSPFAIVLLVSSLLIQLLLTVTEFNYMETFGAHFSGTPSEGAIAEFLGRCRALIAFANILVGLFLYNRCVRRLGINNALLITPLFFLGLYLAWVFQNGISVAILGLVAVDGLLFIIEDNCFNLLYNAVPTKLKSKVRIINDSFFEPVGMLLSATLLFAFESSSRSLGFILTLLFLAFTLMIRKLYSGAILLNLKENALHFERKLSDWISFKGKRFGQEMKRELLAALKVPPLESQLLAIEALLELKDPTFLPSILTACQSFGTIGKIQLLRLLDTTPFSNHFLILETIDAWLGRSESSELSKWARLYLAKRGFHHSDRAEKDLDHPDLFLRGASILTLKNRALAGKKLEEMLASKHIDEIALGLEILAEKSPKDAFERAYPFLSHESLFVKRSAAKALSKLSSPKYFFFKDPLMKAVFSSKDHTLRLSLLSTLEKMMDPSLIKDLLFTSLHFRPSERRFAENLLVKMGSIIIEPLLALTQDISLPERARILASKALSRLSLTHLRDHLIALLDIEIDRAYFYFYFAHTIQKRFPLYDLDILQSALLSGYQSVIDFIIHLLGAAGSLEDPGLLVRSLCSRNEKVHSQAVESLERTCDPRIFRLILPLVDDLPLEEKMSACLAWHGNQPLLSLSELLTKLEKSPSLFDKIVSLRLKAKLELPSWREELQEQIKDANPQFKQYAYELLQT